MSSEMMFHNASTGTTSAFGWGSRSSGTRGATQRKHMVPQSWPTVAIQLPRHRPSALGSACATISVNANQARQASWKGFILLGVLTLMMSCAV